MVGIMEEAEERAGPAAFPSSLMSSFSSRSCVWKASLDFVYDTHTLRFRDASRSHRRQSV